MVEANWISQKQNLYNIIRSPEHFLGDEDAAVEWADEENKSVDIFLHTSSYDDFKRKDCLYLFGQRGSGKTAMMNMLLHEVRQRRISEYRYAWMVNQEDAYDNLSIRGNQFPDLPQHQLEHILQKEWEWIFNISAMASVVRASYRDDREDKDLSIMIKYLRDKKVLEDTSIHFKKKFLNQLTENIRQELKHVDIQYVKLGIAAVDIVEKLLFTTEYESAQAALLRILKRLNMRCLVMVDSKENYSLYDKIEQAIVTALIEAARNFYIDEPTNHILVKVAFPSEFSSHLIIPNKEKTLGKSMFILWTYRDIISLIAKRYWRLIHKNWNAEDLKRLDDFNVSQHFLYQHFPQKITYSNNMPFDTMAYIIRHTHKKPRQVISLLNVILYHSKKEKNDISTISEAHIIKGIHSNLNDLVSGCLNMYTQVYKKAEEIVKRGLKGSKSYFDYSALDKHLKEVSSLRAESKLSSDDVKRLLLSAGVLGIQQSRYDLQDCEMAIVEALFEYQVKDTLILTNNDICVVHPMFYDPLEICVDVNTFVYPKPAEDEKEITIKDIGNRNG